MARKVNLVVGQNPRESSLRLNNGDLVIYDNKIVYMVSSYIAECDSMKPEQYCSLVILETGAKAFKEHASRCTSYTRIARHLASHLNYADPDKIAIVRKEKYDLNIELLPRERY